MLAGSFYSSFVYSLCMVPPQYKFLLLKCAMSTKAGLQPDGPPCIYHSDLSKVIQLGAGGIRFWSGWLLAVGCTRKVSPT